MALGPKALELFFCFPYTINVKIRVHSVFIFIVSVLVLSASALPACAQKRQVVKYLAEETKAVKGVKIPAVVNHKLSLATQQRVAQFSNFLTQQTLRQSAAATATVPSSTLSAPGLDVSPAPGSMVPSYLQSEFLTGPQALEKFRPGWKSELLLSGFTESELTAIEETFVETDRFLFETDPSGTWLGPLGNDWEYANWFSLVLHDKIALNESQVKTLFGKFSCLDDVFTRLNLQAFWLVNGRAPKSGAAGEEGKLARHVKYNLDKRDGNKMNPEVERYIYGNREVIVAQSEPVEFSAPTPTYGPKGRTPRRTPDEVLEQVLQFIRDNGRFPIEKGGDPEERSLRRAFNHACEKAEAQNLKDGTSQRLLALKAQWVREKADARTVQEVLTELETFIERYHRYPSLDAEDPAEKSLRNATDNAIMRAEDPQDPTIVRLTNLKKQWVRDIKRPEQVLTELEVFIEKYHRYPSQTAEDLAERSLRNSVDDAIKRAKDPQDPTIVRLTYLKTQWVKEKADARTPQEVLTELETFIAENDRYPSQTAEDPIERSLYCAVDNAIRRAKDPEDPVIVRLTSLKEQWERKGRTPQEVLTELENFIEKYRRYPSREAEDPIERSLRDAADGVIMRAKDPQDPIITQLVALKAQWVREKTESKTPQEILDQVKAYRATHNGKNPSAYATDKEEKNLRFAWNYIYYKYKNVPLEDIEDPTTRELVQLHRETIKPHKNKVH